eukprot:4436069-Pleurochrysis_carterae.AAC.1
MAARSIMCSCVAMLLSRSATGGGGSTKKASSLQATMYVLGAQVWLLPWTQERGERGWRLSRHHRRGDGSEGRAVFVR